MRGQETPSATRIWQGEVYEILLGAILGLTLLAGLCAAAAARAQDASKDASQAAVQSCEVPAYLLTSDSPLPKVADAVKSGHSLDILVVGSRSSTIPSSEASAFPARLQAYLKERLPSVIVNVSVELQAKKTAKEAATDLVKFASDKKATLVVWQTGTVDAMRSVDPDDFRGAVDDGVAALQKAGI